MHRQRQARRAEDDMPLWCVDAIDPARARPAAARPMGDATKLLDESLQLLKDEALRADTAMAIAATSKSGTGKGPGPQHDGAGPRSEPVEVVLNNTMVPGQRYAITMPRSSTLEELTARASAQFHVDVILEYMCKQPEGHDALESVFTTGRLRQAWDKAEMDDKTLELFCMPTTSDCVSKKTESGASKGTGHIESKEAPTDDSDIVQPSHSSIEQTPPASGAGSSGGSAEASGERVSDHQAPVGLGRIPERELPSLKLIRSAARVEIEEARQAVKEVLTGKHSKSAAAGGAPAMTRDAVVQNEQAKRFNQTLLMQSFKRSNLLYARMIGDLHDVARIWEEAASVPMHETDEAKMRREAMEAAGIPCPKPVENMRPALLAALLERMRLNLDACSRGLRIFEQESGVVAKCREIVNARTRPIITPVALVTGRTGSGKSTQIPQILQQYGIV